MPDRPLVSVIIPVHNRPRLVAEALDSAISQDYVPMEIVVVDDGSTDATTDTLRAYANHARVTRQDNRGAGAARNRGVEISRGEYLAFLDSDDLWLPEKTSLQAALLQHRPEVDIVYGHVLQFLDTDLDPSRRGRVRCPDVAMPGYIPSAMMVRRSAFLAVGPFETTWAVGEYMSWHLRAIEGGLRMEMLAPTVCLRRLHDSNKGVSQREQIAQRAEILLTALRRRR